MSWRRVLLCWALAAALFAVLQLFPAARRPGPAGPGAPAGGDAAAPATTVPSGDADSRAEGSSGDGAAPAPTPAPIDPAAIDRIEIRGQPSLVRLERHGSTFAVTLPPGGSIAPGLVDAFLEQLAQAGLARPLGEATDLAGFGLTPPRLVIALRRSDGAERRIELGGPNPASTAVYARFEGTPGVFLVGLNLSYYADLVRQALGADALDRSASTPRP